MFIDIAVLEEQKRQLQERKERVMKEIQILNQEFNRMNQSISIQSINQISEEFQHRLNDYQKNILLSIETTILDIEKQTIKYDRIHESTQKEIIKLITLLDDLKI